MSFTVADTSASQQRALLLALLASLLLWNLPFGGLLLYPFKLLATWFHEMSHGLTMLVTGAGFEHLEIFRDTSGIAQAKRGVGPAARAAIASAGYLGTSLFGAVFLVVGQSKTGARSILAATGALMALSAILWIRNDFGFGVALAGATISLGLAMFGGQKVAVLLVNFTAAQSCVNALLDIRVLFRTEMVINGEVVGNSDAHNMASASFGNHWFWASAWLVFSVVAFYVALRLIYLRHAAQPSIEKQSSPGPAETQRSDSDSVPGGDCADSPSRPTDQSTASEAKSSTPEPSPTESD